MAEQHLQEDEAARYVLGQLTPAEQREFETQLAQSAELRVLVQELEEGVEALARTVPQCPPPPQMWAPIKQAIAQEAREKIVTSTVWSNWWRNGWAAAAACLIGWLGYALWTHRGAGRLEAPALAVTVTVPGTLAPAPVESNRIAALPNVAAVAAAANANRELGGLRQQVVMLQTQLQQLTHVVARQQAIQIEPGRFKMFPLATNTTSGEPVPPLSPELQRALFYAMARELGWLPATVPGEAQNPGGATNHQRVDFVDLNTPTNNLPATAEDDATEQAYFAPASIGSSGNIPGFVSGTNLVMAFDASIVANGSPLSFWLSSATENYQWVGTTVMSDNTTVVTIPASTETGWKLTVTAGSASGSSNVIGQFFTH